MHNDPDSFFQNPSSSLSLSSPNPANLRVSGHNRLFLAGGAIRHKPMQSTSRAGTRTPRPTFRRVPTHTEARVRMHRLAVVTMRIRPPSTLSPNLHKAHRLYISPRPRITKKNQTVPQQQRLVHDRLLVSLKLTLYRHATRRSSQSHQRRSFTATKARIRSHA